MLPEASAIQHYYVYEYTFLDDLSFIKAPAEVFLDSDPVQLDTTIEAVRSKFLQAHWEGDGDIGILWLPPFVSVGVEDTCGAYIWHVKQNNDGISFLASAYPLSFPRLDWQNRHHEIAEPGGRSVNIVDTAVSGLRRDIESHKTQLLKNLDHVRLLPAGDVVDVIVSDLLVHYQGLLVRTLTEFLDDCYLHFLIEVINNGNAGKIKLQKAKIHIDPHHYQPDEDLDDPLSSGATEWLTLRSLITDLWKGFKFEPYKTKLQMLFGAVEFKLEEKVQSELTKHVMLRNCIEHHEGKLNKDSLRHCGTTNVTMLKADSIYELKAWDKIVFTVEELIHFACLEDQLAIDFSCHVDKRIPTRQLRR